MATSCVHQLSKNTLVMSAMLLHVMGFVWDLVQIMKPWNDMPKLKKSFCIGNGNGPNLK